MCLHGAIAASRLSGSGSVTQLDDRQMRSTGDALELEDELFLHTRVAMNEVRDR